MWKNDREISFQASVNILRSRDRGRGDPQILNRRLRMFELRARHCKQYHVYTRTLSIKQKILDIRSRRR